MLKLTFTILVTIGCVTAKGGGPPGGVPGNYEHVPGRIGGPGGIGGVPGRLGGTTGGIGGVPGSYRDVPRDVGSVPDNYRSGSGVPGGRPLYDSVPDSIVGLPQGSRRRPGGADGGQSPKPYHFDTQTTDEEGNTFIRSEQGDANGNVKGSYGYRSNDGLYRMVEYEADARGFKPIVRTNEPGTDGKENPADVQMVVENPPAGLQEMWTKAAVNRQGGGGSQYRPNVGGGSQPGSNIGGGSQYRSSVGGGSQYGSNIGGGSQYRTNVGGRSQQGSNVGGGSQPGSNIGGGSQYRSNVGGKSQYGSNTGGGSQYRSNVGGRSQYGSNTGDGSQSRSNVGGGSQYGSNVGPGGQQGSNIGRDSSSYKTGIGKGKPFTDGGLSAVPGQGVKSGKSGY